MNELIKRNTVEIITEEELRKLENPIVYCGYEPSGPLHLGHMVTITKLMDLKKAGFKVKVLLADLHALLNRKGDEKFINNQCKIWEKCIRAIGLNAKFFIGSKFQFNKEYWKDVLTMSLTTTVKRGMRSMTEIARDFDNAMISQMLYPLMQVEDIKALDVTVALGGLEQRKVHMIAREVLPKVDYNAPVCIHTPLIDSLLGMGKMSSSISGSNISVIDSDEIIDMKVKRAYCISGEAKTPILQIAKLIIFPRIKKMKIEREKKFGGYIEVEYEELEKLFKIKKVHPLDLKNSVAKELKKIIAPIRKNFD